LVEAKVKVAWLVVSCKLQGTSFCIPVKYYDPLTLLGEKNQSNRAIAAVCSSLYVHYLIGRFELRGELVIN
jgi:hypothetical protein